ncbi:MAG: PilN domain-containing protein [Armatimonadetes bacterium]|nr:PilN domain-containing protein [Armatimonadota bacterium]
MRPFNFAESKMTERNYCRAQMNRYMRIMCLTAIVAGLVAIGSYACSRRTHDEDVRVKAELAALEQQCSKARQEIKSAKTVLCEYEWGKQLSHKSEVRLAKVNAVIDCVPGNVWLNSIDNAPSDPLLTVVGKAISFDALSIYTDRLRRLAMFDDVRIVNTAVGIAGNVRFLTFSLSLKIRQTESPITTVVSSIRPSVVGERP